MVFDLFLYSVTVQAKNYIQTRMPTEVSKYINFITSRKSIQIRLAYDLPIPLVLLLSSTKIRMLWEHQFLLTERRCVPAYHRFKVIPLVWSYALFQLHNWTEVSSWHRRRKVGGVIKHKWKRLINKRFAKPVGRFTKTSFLFTTIFSIANICW